MQNYNSDGDFVGPGGIVVPGMYHGEDGKVDRSTWQQLIPVSDEMLIILMLGSHQFKA